MRRSVLAAVVSSALGAAALTAGLTALGAAESGGVADAGRAAVRVGPVDRPVLIVSDSASLGIKTYGAKDALRGVDHVMDLASCRRRVVDSCRNYDGHLPITLLDEMDAHGRHFHTLFVATGYNDSDRNFVAEVDTIIRRSRELGYERVVWMTLRSNVAYESTGDYGRAEVYRNVNAALRDLVAAGTYPELVIADWAAYSRDRSDWFAADGIHVRGEGPWAVADFFSRKLAFLDGRPCPLPAAPGQAPADPCPDPDAAAPTVDLRGIYPVGEPNPTAGFFMEWEGSSDWPAPPWWE
jgi:hypothetical protein